MKKREPSNAVPVISDESRAARFRRKQQEEGLVQVAAWVPSHCAPDFYVIAAALRDDRDLVFGPPRNFRTGHFKKV